MTIYDKLKDVFIFELCKIAGLSEDVAMKELSAFEFELRKLAEKVENGECPLEDAIQKVIKKVKIYRPPVFRKIQDVGELHSVFEGYKKQKQSLKPKQDYIEEMIEKGYTIDVITGEKITPKDMMMVLPEGPTKKENWDKAVEFRKKLKKEQPKTHYSWCDIFKMVRENCTGANGPEPQIKQKEHGANFRYSFAVDLALSKKLIVTEEEFIEFVEIHQPPKGYIWARTPFGAPLGLVKVYLKKLIPPKYSDTDLERKFEEILNELGFKEGIDYQKQYLFFTYRIDFAFPHLKIAFEPGATYYHTPKWVEGEALDPFGFSPEEVYYPAKPEDIKKDKLLKRNGWIVGWLNENFVKNLSQVMEWVNEIVSM